MSYQCSLFTSILQQCNGCSAYEIPVLVISQAIMQTSHAGETFSALHSQDAQRNINANYVSYDLVCHKTSSQIAGRAVSYFGFLHWF